MKTRSTSIMYSNGSLNGWATRANNASGRSHPLHAPLPTCAYSLSGHSYEIGGTPLPFASDAVFNKLFPASSGPTLPVTKPDFMVVPAQKHTYTPSTIPACPHCAGPRVFECQLMPNLINVLHASQKDGETQKKLSDEERRQQVLKEIKGEAAEGRVDMGWGTCMVFSCQKDCSDEAAGGCWREELVLVQWDE